MTNVLQYMVVCCNTWWNVGQKWRACVNEYV